MSADTSYSVNVKWDSSAPAAPPAAAVTAPEKVSFLPQYDAVEDAGSTRGRAVSEVLLRCIICAVRGLRRCLQICFEIVYLESITDRDPSVLRGATGTAFSHGVLSNGTAYAFPITVAGDADNTDNHLNEVNE